MIRSNQMYCLIKCFEPDNSLIPNIAVFSFLLGEEENKMNHRPKYCTFYNEQGRAITPHSLKNKEEIKHKQDHQNTDCV